LGRWSNTRCDGGGKTVTVARVDELGRLHPQELKAGVSEQGAIIDIFVCQITIGFGWHYYLAGEIHTTLRVV